MAKDSTGDGAELQWRDMWLKGLVEPGSWKWTVVKGWSW